jgi:hypothetical protein
MSFNYAVAYSVADPLTKLPTAAGQVLGAALAAADAGQAPNVVLPLLLASSQTAVVADFSQGRADSCHFVSCFYVMMSCHAQLAAQVLVASPADL